MNIHYNKYLKYKNKYVNLKNGLNATIFKGGTLFDVGSELLESDINDEFNLLMYHGSLTEKIFKIPENIILILSDCCGSGNYAKQTVWYNPFTELSESSFLLNSPKKNDIISDIQEGKINIDGQKYNILKPGSKICDFVLETFKNNFAAGHHIKKFDDTPFYDTQLILTNKIKFIQIFKKIETYLLKLNTIKSDTYDIIFSTSQQYSKTNFCYLSKSIDIQILLYMFYINYSETLYTTSDLNDIYHFILNINYEQFVCFKSKIMIDESLKLFINEMKKNNINIGIGKGESNISNLTNYDILLFLFFNKLIKKDIEIIKLSDKLNEINDTIDKPTFVILYACQGGESMCIISDCYKRLQGIDDDIFFMNKFIKDIIDVKNPDANILLYNTPIIGININDSIELLNDIKIKDPKFHLDTFFDSFDTFNIFVNLFYDIMNNTNDIYPELKMGKLILNSDTFIKASILKNIYGSNYITLLFLVNNSSYLENFMNEFGMFIQILKIYIKDKITVEKFMTLLNKKEQGIYKLYTNILNTYKNYMNKIFFPNDINNKSQLNILFQNITFNIKESRDFCKNPDDFLITNPTILDNFNIFIMSSYTGHEIVSFYNLNVLVNSENCKKLKIKYIKHLIKQYDCEQLVKQSKITSVTRDAF